MVKNSPQKHLIVDGYNVIHAWPVLRREMNRNVNLARERLIRMLQGLHDGEGLRVTVVFDGQGTELSVDRPAGDVSFSVLHTPSSMSADGVIEQLVAASRHPEVCQVVTQDNLISETVLALGAAPLTPDELKDWIRRAEVQTTEEIRKTRKKADQQWKQR